ncbi:iron-sulfur cluster biosynthesis family protein [Paenibacillus sp. SI8]|uniref:iron-sulfur cluster biosynthesis family protein n=1 Tax=unclassified Paenibacillus TaxID=185978 RepID=UPI003466B651
MKITFTDTAIERITALMGSRQGMLKLVFDTEDCGCSVNGVPTLWIVTEAETGDLHAEVDPFQLIYKPKDEIFFEALMKLDYHPGNKSYILKSNSQIYNAHMSVIDKR